MSPAPPSTSAARRRRLAALLCLGIALALGTAVVLFQQNPRGALIHVRVTDTSRIIPGETHLLCRGVPVGTVETISQNSLAIRIDPRHPGLLHADSRISLSRLSLPKNDVLKIVEDLLPPILEIEPGFSTSITSLDFIAIEPPPPPSPDPSRLTFLGQEISPSLTTSPPLPR